MTRIQPITRIGAACVFLFLTPCRGDTLTGEIRGSLLDVESRNPLAGVSMTLTSADRGWKKQLQTEWSGHYLFMQLEPGRYSLLAEKEGFYSTEKTDILVRLNQPKVVIPPIELRKLVATPTRQLTLRGEQTKTAIIDLAASGSTPVILAIVKETGLTSLVSLVDGVLRANYDASVVHYLPLEGTRTFDQLALLSPGVFRVPFSSGQGPAVGNGMGTAGQFAVNGLRGRSNNFTVDGSDNNDEDIGVRRQGFVTLTAQTIESVEEFQIVTGAFPAEFGRNSGSMVNAVSRSGKRDLQGAIYGFLTHPRLSARGFFHTRFADSANPQNENLERRQYGAVLGGPIAREKLFYFLAAEKQGYEGRSVGHFVVPRAGERGLRTRQGFIPLERLGEFLKPRNTGYSDLAGKGIFELYPLPNNPRGPFREHTYSQVRESTGSGKIVSGKVDWYVSTVHSVTARYNFSDDQSVLPFTSEAINSSLGTATRTQNLSLFLNSSSSRYANALRVSYGRTRLAFPPDEGSPLLFGSAPSTELPDFSRMVRTPYGRFGPFGTTGPIGQLWIAPYSPVGIDVFNFPQGRVDNTFQISDFFSRRGSAHFVKVGFDIRRSQLNSFSDRNSRPLVLFGAGLISSGCMQNPLCPFATEDGLLRGTDLASLGAPGGFLQALSTAAVADSTIGLRVAQYDFFVHDEWRVAQNLILNLGIRYELQQVPSEVNRRIEKTLQLTPSAFPRLSPEDFPQMQAIVVAGNQAFDSALQGLQRLLAGRRNIYDLDRNNLAPRLGLAWDPWGRGRTAIRLGYSWAHDANLGAVTSQSRNVFPTFVPLNLDLNFRPPSGLLINSPTFFTFLPTQTPLIRPGTLNSYNLGEQAFATGLGVLFIQAPPLPGASLSSNGLAFTLPEKELKTGSAHQFVLSIEKQVGDNLAAALSYVGTRGLHLTRFVTPNGGLVSTPVLFFPVSGSQRLMILNLPAAARAGENGRPQAHLGSYVLFANSADSDYHSLQLSMQQRLWRGLQFLLSWTWSHSIDQVSDPFEGRGFYSLPQRLDDARLERAASSFDVRHRLAWFFIWQLPRLSDRWWLRDWNLSSIGEFQTGQPFTVNSVLDRNLDGNLTDRLDSTSGLSVQRRNPQLISMGSSVSTVALLAPLGKDGRVGRNTFRADGIAKVDLALWRTIRLTETTRLDVRMEVFNVFNRTHLGIPVRILESPGFGRTYDTQVPARSLRIAAKFMF